jgi:hypothetical protein
MADRTVGGRVATTDTPTWLDPALVAHWLRTNVPDAGSPDAAELDRVCAAAEAYVERCRPEWWLVDEADPEEVVYNPDAETLQGAVMYAAREVRRRNSPSGVETAIDGNPVFVSRYDSDIERALRTGTWNRPGVG